MKDFKHITAHLNSKGELEVRAYPELPPSHIYSDHPDEKLSNTYQAALKVWLSSAEVFSPFDDEQEVKINAELIARCLGTDGDWSDKGYEDRVSKGVDLTENVYIYNGYAFYKSPKDQPEQTEGESQEELWDSLVEEWTAASLVEHLPDGGVLAYLKSKFIIKRR